MAGEEISPAALIRRVMQPKSWVLPEELGLPPTEVEIADALRSAKVGKAAGGDALPHGLGRGCPVEMALLLLPLSRKPTLRGCEAVGVQAGLLRHMFKGRGDRSNCTSRGVARLISSLGKCLRRTLRPRLAKHFNDVAAPCQLGGRVGKAVVFAVHAVKAYIRDKVNRHFSGQWSSQTLQLPTTAL